MSRLRKYFSLPPAERRLLGSAALRLLLAWLALRVLPFSLLMRTLKGRSGTDPGVSCERGERIAKAVANAVMVASRNLAVTLTCLPQGLATCWILQAYGAAPQLHYGTQAIGQGRFSSHVWVELDGRGIIGHSIAPDFVTLAIFPRSPHS
jgi:hypothetical protein